MTHGGWRGNPNSIANLQRGHPKGQTMPGAKTAARTSSPLIRQLFDIIDNTGLAASAIAHPAGIHTVTLSGWKHGKQSPRIVDFENVCQLLGHKLVLVPIDEDTDEQSRLP